MPELPEVETVVRGLQAILPGRTVCEVDGKAPTEIIGKTIDQVTRYGKFIVIHFPCGMLFVHLGMTGQLRMSEESGKFTRARIYLDHGILRYDDIRKFGKIYWAQAYPLRGPDPLEISAADFTIRAKLRKTKIKALLLDQSFLRGMGNIYTDEALFRSGIHPKSSAAKLSKPRLVKLHAVMVAILEEAVAAGGSSISDYVNAKGERGSFQDRHRVYGKHGKPCPGCGTTLVRTLVVQRGTTFCPSCQKR